MSRAKRKMYVPAYWDLDEEDLQLIIWQAQLGQSEEWSDQYRAVSAKAVDQLLEIFDNYLSKYIAMLWDNKFNLNHWDIRYFINMFNPNKELAQNIKRKNFNKKTVKGAHEVIGRLQMMLRRYGNLDDLHQTVKMSFLSCVMRYERVASSQGEGEWVPFSGFLYRYFLYVVKADVEEYLTDQLGLKTFPIIPAENPSDDSEHDYVPGFKLPSHPDASEDTINAVNLDDTWVAGLTCEFPFNKLSVNERQLLKWYYVNGESSIEISQRLNEHSNTTKGRLNKIEDKLERFLNLPDEIALSSAML